jgi:hypothetical protein
MRELVIVQPSGFSQPIEFIFTEHPVERRTVTTVDVRAGNYLVGTGASICAPDDVCRREIGRQKAVARALQHHPRHVRKLLTSELRSLEGGYGHGV